MSAPDKNLDALLDLFALFMRNSMHSAVIHSREAGLSMPQLRTLMILHHKGASAITEIAEGLNVSTAAASQMVDRMVHEGLILRAEDPNDRRVKQIRMTDKGSEVLKENFSARRAWFIEMIKSLTDDEREQVYRAFELLVRKLGPQEQLSNSEIQNLPKT
ncbi:MAG: MarR family transcriptional regulator [Anaerolineales bacterium]|nr:MarR family transcriptional regulator [Anaerolineales bacterium]